MVIITGRHANKDNNTTVVLLLSREWWDGLRELDFSANPQPTPLIVQGVYEGCADYYYRGPFLLSPLSTRELLQSLSFEKGLIEHLKPEPGPEPEPINLVFRFLVRLGRQ